MTRCVPAWVWHADTLRGCSPCPMFLAQTFTTSSCCAKQLDADGIPDFSELDIKVTPGCDAPNAERIVKGLCAGKQECTVRRERAALI